MRLGKLVVLGASLWAAAQAIGWMNRWGASEAEVVAVYPGDELVADPATQATMAVTVAADPERIWSWLVQIGQDRGGMYSYDWLERAVGLEITSAEAIREEWQHLVPGDLVRVVPPGWGPLVKGYAFKVAQVDPPHALVLRQCPPEDPWDGVWTFVVTSVEPGVSRLVTRMRTRQDVGVVATALRPLTALGVPITWVMTRKMLLGIKERAERT